MNEFQLAIKYLNNGSKENVEMSGTNTEGLGDKVVPSWPRNDLLIGILPSKMIKTKLKT